MDGEENKREMWTAKWFVGGGGGLDPSYLKVYMLLDFVGP
jgi:hypothetical protein